MSSSDLGMRRVLLPGMIGLLTAAVAACSGAGGHSGTSPSVAMSSQGHHAISPGASSHRILAHARISADVGGSVSAKGVALTVPAHALATNGTATISQSAPGIYDVSVDAGLAAPVAVTVPLSGPNDLVVHYVNGGWRIESARFGQQTVWVAHLSPFSALSNLVKKAACLKSLNPREIVSCLLLKGIKSVSVGFASWLARQGNLGDACLQRIIGSGGYLSAFYHAFSGACVAQAGGPGYTWPPTPGNGGGTSPGSATTPAEVPPPPPSPQPPPPSPAGPVFPVMNTSETLPDGVWFRNSPHVNDTSRVTGLGVYSGERVQLHCYGWGDSVGPYNDRLWYYVTNVTRPTNNGTPNQGWLNAHYINDGQLANVVDTGVPAC